MKKLLDNSVIEVWSGKYINNLSGRSLVDKRAKIIQIESGSSDNDYIVEIVREEEDVKKDEFIKKRLNILKEE
jgi:hypothetical protein|nr:MAG TPA: hypothetical protein [Caudoviricetes sp.]